MKFATVATSAALFGAVAVALPKAQYEPPVYEPVYTPVYTPEYAPEYPPVYSTAPYDPYYTPPAYPSVTPYPYYPSVTPYPYYPSSTPCEEPEVYGTPYGYDDTYSTPCDGKPRLTINGHSVCFTNTFWRFR